MEAVVTPSQLRHTFTVGVRGRLQDINAKQTHVSLLRYALNNLGKIKHQFTEQILPPPNGLNLLGSIINR